MTREANRATLFVMRKGRKILSNNRKPPAAEEGDAAACRRRESATRADHVEWFKSKAFARKMSIETLKSSEQMAFSGSLGIEV